MKNKFLAIAENTGKGAVKTLGGGLLSLIGYSSFPAIQLIGGGVLAAGGALALSNKLLNNIGIKDKTPNKILSYTGNATSRLGDSLLTAPISGALLAAEGIASIVTQKKQEFGVKIFNQEKNKIESYGTGYLLTNAFPHLYRNSEKWPSTVLGWAKGTAKGLAKTGAGYVLSVVGIINFPTQQLIGAALLTAGFFLGKEEGNPIRRIGDSFLTSPVSGIIFITEGISGIILQKDIKIGIKQHSKTTGKIETFGVGYFVTDVVPHMALACTPNFIKSTFSSKEKQTTDLFPQINPQKPEHLLLC